MWYCIWISRGVKYICNHVYTLFLSIIGVVKFSPLSHVGVINYSYNSLLHFLISDHIFFYYKYSHIFPYNFIHFFFDLPFHPDFPLLVFHPSSVQTTSINSFSFSQLYSWLIHLHLYFVYGVYYYTIIPHIIHLYIYF